MSSVVQGSDISLPRLVDYFVHSNPGWHNVPSNMRVFISLWKFWKNKEMSVEKMDDLKVLIKYRLVQDIKAEEILCFLQIKSSRFPSITSFQYEKHHRNKELKPFLIAVQAAQLFDKTPVSSLHHVVHSVYKKPKLYLAACAHDLGVDLTWWTDMLVSLRRQFMRQLQLQSGAKKVQSYRGQQAISVADGFASENYNVQRVAKRNFDGETVEQRLSKTLQAAGATGFIFRAVPSDYYERTYEERRDLLDAASVDHLCKSIVMVNTQAHECSKVKDCSDRKNWKYCVVIIQYTARLNAEKIEAFVHSLNERKISKERFNLRLSPEEESNKLTGYEHNAVTPIGLREDVPVILSDAIVKLSPRFFGLAEGR